MGIGGVRGGEGETRVGGGVGSTSYSFIFYFCPKWYSFALVHAQARCVCDCVLI